jgi:hypothetical protein
MVDPRLASPCGRFADVLPLGLDCLEALLPGLECFAEEWRLGGAGTALGDDVVPGGDIAKFGICYGERVQIACLDVDSQLGKVVLIGRVLVEWPLDLEQGGERESVTENMIYIVEAHDTADMTCSWRGGTTSFVVEVAKLEEQRCTPNVQHTSLSVGDQPESGKSSFSTESV